MQKKCGGCGTKKAGCAWFLLYAFAQGIVLNLLANSWQVDTSPPPGRLGATVPINRGGGWDRSLPGQTCPGEGEAVWGVTRRFRRDTEGGGPEGGTGRD